MTDKEKEKVVATPAKPKAKVSKQEEFINNELMQTETRLNHAAAQVLHAQDQVDSLRVLRDALKDALKKLDI